MSAVPAAAAGLAFAAALGYGLASLLQAVGARQATGLTATLRSPAYLIGLLLDLLAWLASLAALRTLPIYAVQAVLAGSLAVTALAARIVVHTTLRRRDAVAIGMTVVALAVLAAAAGPQEPSHLSGPVRWGITVAAAVLACGGWVAVRAGATALSAVLAGAAFGGAAVAARGLRVPAHPLLVLLDPLAWALVLFGVTGMLLYAAALERGHVARVTALLWITEVVLPAAAGIVLLGDAARPGWGLTACGAVAVTVVAAAVLAGAPAEPRVRRAAASLGRPASPR